MARLDLTPETPAKGPYSSLFNWEEEQTSLDRAHQQRQEAQKKIARINSMGEAFKLLVDSIGGVSGATITPRTINPGILSAVEQYGKNEADYFDKLERLKTKQMAVKQADLQHDLGIAAEQRSEQRKSAERQEERTWQDARAEVEHQRSLERIGKQAEITQANIDAQRQKELDVYEGKKKIDKAILDRVKEGFGKRLDKSDVEFITPDTGQRIYLRDAEITYLFNHVTENKTKYSAGLAPTLKKILDAKSVPSRSEMLELSRAWSQLKEVLPGFMEWEYMNGGSPQQPAGATGPQAGYVPGTGGATQPSYNGPIAPAGQTAQVTPKPGTSTGSTKEPTPNASTNQLFREAVPYSQRTPEQQKQETEKYKSRVANVLINPSYSKEDKIENIATAIRLYNDQITWEQAREEAKAVYDNAKKANPDKIVDAKSKKGVVPI